MVNSTVGLASVHTPLGQEGDLGRKDVITVDRDSGPDLGGLASVVPELEHLSVAETMTGAETDPVSPTRSPAPAPTAGPGNRSIARVYSRR